jgi:hypothetical protein
MTLLALSAQRSARVQDPLVEGGSVPRGSEASRAERLPTVVSGRSIRREHVLRDDVAARATASLHTGIRMRVRRDRFSRMRRLTTTAPPRGLPTRRKHARREVRRKLVSQAGLSQGRDGRHLSWRAGGAALADTRALGLDPPRPSHHATRSPAPPRPRPQVRPCQLSSRFRTERRR